MGELDTKRYWESRLGAHMDFRGVGDIGLPVSYNRCLYRVRRQAFRRAVADLLPDWSRATVLDAGSGTGFYVERWLELGVRDLTGSDLTDVAVAALGRRFPDQGFLSLNLAAPLPETLAGRRFDVVSCLDVLFHIIDDPGYRQALDNFARLVRPGGWLVISDNLRPHQEQRLTHQVSRTESRILAMLEQAGFVPRRRRAMFVLMNDPTRSRSRLLHALFSRIYRWSARGEAWGAVIGHLLLPLELLLIRLVAPGPSTEILVLERRND
ncbi:MAG: class I SAM-dependent methyltransferase [Magnetococcales bacterium]|nr:class I SAM-dependent methyltransferase [Magnetococcales bacterium]